MPMDENIGEMKQELDKESDWGRLLVADVRDMEIALESVRCKSSNLGV